MDLFTIVVTLLIMSFTISMDNHIIMNGIKHVQDTKEISAHYELKKDISEWSDNYQNSELLVNDVKTYNKSELKKQSGESTENFIKRIKMNNKDGNNVLDGDSINKKSFDIKIKNLTKNSSDIYITTEIDKTDVNNNKSDLRLDTNVTTYIHEENIYSKSLREYLLKRIPIPSLPSHVSELTYTKNEILGNKEYTIDVKNPFIFREGTQLKVLVIEDLILSTVLKVDYTVLSSDNYTGYDLTTGQFTPPFKLINPTKETYRLETKL